MKFHKNCFVNFKRSKNRPTTWSLPQPLPKTNNANLCVWVGTQRGVELIQYTRWDKRNKRIFLSHHTTAHGFGRFQSRAHGKKMRKIQSRLAATPHRVKHGEWWWGNFWGVGCELRSWFKFCNFSLFVTIFIYICRKFMKKYVVFVCFPNFLTPYDIPNGVAKQFKLNDGKRGVLSDRMRGTCVFPLNANGFE